MVYDGSGLVIRPCREVVTEQAHALIMAAGGTGAVDRHGDGDGNDGVSS
jgi:hypothetical protein